MANLNEHRGICPVPFLQESTFPANSGCNSPLLSRLEASTDDRQMFMDDTVRRWAR